MPLQIEPALPDKKYIRKFNKRTRGETTHLSLEVILPSAFGADSELQKLLQNHNIPIDSIKTREGAFYQRKVFYSGSSDEVGKYLLSIRISSYDERITLTASKNSEELGRMPKLVSVIQEYTDLYETSENEENN